MTEKKKLVYLQTFGCQMNDRDSEAVKGLFVDGGYAFVEKPEEADVVLYNTCSVRDHAEQRVFGRMGHFRLWKQSNPDLVIGILGCMAQEHGADFFRRNPEIDLVCGPSNLRQVAGLVEEIRSGRASRGQLATDALGRDYSLEGIGFRVDDVKALVTIMTGCDHRCTYCIVPYTRGAERSRTTRSILDEVRDLEARKFREIMLLGQNVNSYGKGLEEGVDFADLLRLIQRETPGIARLRFTTSHPKDAHARLFEAMRDLPMVCEHLHLPVQSGSDRVLRRMKREHTRDWYLEQIRDYRRLVPGGSLTTDLIVGFPGETEEDFLQTLSLVEDVQYDGAFIFKYSPRPGTPALKLDDDVSEEEKSRRHETLLAAQRRISFRKHREEVGRDVEVLFESVSPKSARRYFGRTRSFRRVIVPSDEDLRGRLLRVRITGAADETLLGELAGGPS